MTLSTSEAARAHLLVYDIPQSARMVNPSAMLWGLGARINLSCWIIPDRNIVRVPVADWKARGATVEMVRFDERDGETIIRLARESLERHLREIRDACEASMTGALEKLELIATGDEPALKKGKAGVASVTWRAKRDLERAMECALTFDLTADVDHLFAAARLTVAAQEKMAFDALQKKLTAGQQSVLA